MNNINPTGKYILDENGNPVEEPDILKWAEWFEKADRKLARDIVNGIGVSTIFLGIDHAFGYGSKPVLWETMTFGWRDKEDEIQARYTSKDGALKGHYQIVEKLKKKHA